MRKVSTVVFLTGLVAALTMAAQPAQAANKVIFKQVTVGIDVSVYTVPLGKKFIVGSVIIGNPTAQDACCASMHRVLLGGTAHLIMAVGVPASGHFNHNMQNMVLDQGQTLRVRNDSNPAVTQLNFTVTGDLVDR